MNLTSLILSISLSAHTIFYLHLHRAARRSLATGLRILLILLVFTAISASAQSDEWIWQGGSDTYQATIFGTLGTPAVTNNPGGRYGEAFRIDKNGHLWLFGGAIDGGYYQLNDLWEYNPSTKEWAWMGGSQLQNQSGVYGTLGKPSATSMPGGRVYSTTWIDNNGHLWLFGGAGYDSIGNPGNLNDLWEYNPSTSEWAWMSGSKTINENTYGNPGIYGTL